MAIPFFFHKEIVTEGKEIREQENLFSIKLEGYHMFPLSERLIVKRTEKADTSGFAIVKRLIIEENDTTVFYELVSLQSTN